MEHDTNPQIYFGLRRGKTPKAMTPSVAGASNARRII